LREERNLEVICCNTRKNEELILHFCSFGAGCTSALSKKNCLKFWKDGGLGEGNFLQKVSFPQATAPYFKEMNF
jgi:hypothetical protein